jgi:hypothetical protein
MAAMAAMVARPPEATQADSHSCRGPASSPALVASYDGPRVRGLLQLSYFFLADFPQLAPRLWTCNTLLSGHRPRSRRFSVFRRPTAPPHRPFLTPRGDRPGARSRRPAPRAVEAIAALASLAGAVGAGADRRPRCAHHRGLCAGCSHRFASPVRRADQLLRGRCTTYTYLALALSFSHQLATGSSFVGHPLARTCWTARAAA